MKMWAFIVLVVLGAAGCNSYTPKNQGGDNSPLGLGQGTPDFALVQAKIFRPNCIMCHSDGSGNGGGVNLEAYANVKRFIDQIKTSTLVSQSMPPGRPLSQGLKQLLTSWVAAGAPETIAQPSQPQTGPNPPAPEDLQPTFSSISKNILIPKCIMCHGSDTQLPVTDYQFLATKMWIVPGDLEQSSLYDSVKKGRMPPGESITDKELETIGTWITNGAPNN